MNSRKCCVILAFVVLMLPMALTFAKNTSERHELSIKDVQRFTAAISQIKSFYVEPVPDNELFDSAIRGMLTGLDPHSSYLDTRQFKDLRSSTKGEFSGLGIEVIMEADAVKVVTPFDDSPAFVAGVKAGDLIVRIDKTLVKGLSLFEAINKMKGKRGSFVSLTIIRKSENKPLVIKVKRDVVIIKSVKSKLLEKGYGYIRLSYFQEPSAGKIKKAIKKLKAQSGGKLKGLILDLRNNPGGLLDSAVDISDLFLDSNKLGDNKMIVYAEGRIPAARFKATAIPGDILKGAPIVVLINQGSASGAEIVAGALQDHKRAILMGATTFGKGSVQTVLPLDEDTAVKLTTALYYTPFGRSIQAKGVTPDIAVENFTLVQKDKKNKLVGLIKEADLKDHLKGKNSSAKKTKNISKQDLKTKNATHKDFLLYEALHVLKGLAILGNGVKS